MATSDHAALPGQVAGPQPREHDRARSCSEPQDLHASAAHETHIHGLLAGRLSNATRERSSNEHDGFYANRA